MRTFYKLLAGLMMLCSTETMAQFYSIGDIRKANKIQENEIRKQPVCPLKNTGNNKVSKEDIAKQETELKDLSKTGINGNVYYSYPLRKMKVTSSFGYRKDPFTGKQRLHNGLDLRAKYEKVYAMLHGKAIKTGEDRRSGKYVTLQHGNIQISYCHLSKIMVKAGVNVKPGEVVAISGSTGRCSGPHLHITARYKGESVNPAIILNYFCKLMEDENVTVLYSRLSNEGLPLL